MANHQAMHKRAGAVRHGSRNDREESRIGDDGAAGLPRLKTMFSAVRPVPPRRGARSRLLQRQLSASCRAATHHGSWKRLA
jgi:hypothetical protein